MQITLTYKGSDGGSTTHLNHVFESEGGQRYEWYSNSNKLNYLLQDKKMIIDYQVDESFGDVIYIKNVRIKEVI